MKLFAQPGTYAVCRLAAAAPCPAWATHGRFSSVTRTGDELSIVCEASQVPPSIRAESGWVLLKFAGPFAFHETGILHAVVAPLAEARIPVFAVSTFDTDYLLTKAVDQARTLAVLGAHGHEVVMTAES